MMLKNFIDKIESFAEGKIMLLILQSTGNIRSLFQLKEKLRIDLVWFIKDNVLAA